MFKNFEVTVDTVKSVKNQQFAVNTNDLQSLKFLISITQSGAPLDLTGASVRLAIKKPDKLTVFQDCTITDAAAGKCEIVLDTQAYIVPGLHVAEVMVYFTVDEVSVSGRFSYVANKGILDDETVESTNELQSINQAIADVEAVVDDLRQNGTGIDAQARADLVTVASDLAQKANGNVFRDQGSNIVNGYSGNAVASDISQSAILGGGALGWENVIGAETTANVGTAIPNVPSTGTNANLSYILGGYDNVANGYASFIGGFHNVTEAGVTHGSIFGGSKHKISAGDYGTIGGGTQNLVSGTGATIAGGILNTASGVSSAVIGGNNNIASGNYSVVGGNGNTASGTNAIALGSNNNASGYGSIAFGDLNNAIGQYSCSIGFQNTASGVHSFTMGRGAKTSFEGQFAQGNGYFANAGDAQTSVLTLRGTTTTGSQGSVSVNGAGANLAIPEDTTWGFEYFVVARSADGLVAMWNVKGIANRNGTSNATIIGLTKTKIGGSAGTESWDTTVLTSTTLQLKATGEAGKTIKWVSRLTLTQVTDAAA